MPTDRQQATSSGCIDSSQMLVFLTGELAAEQEQLVVEHISTCPACERLAAELSDDPHARRLAAAVGHSPRGADPAALDEVRRRLHVLGLLDPAIWADIETRPHGQTVTAAADRARRVTPPQSPRPAEAHAPGERHVELPVPPRLGHFDIIRQIGAGGFGIVYLAEDRTLHRPVALKVARASAVADPRQHERFFREAEALARLQHPHITPVYEVDEIDGVCFLAMAYCRGESLDAWLASQPRPVHPLLAAQLMVPLADATQHAHHHGILHRDIKPANVLLDPVEEGDSDLPFQPRLTDFGLAKIAQEPSSSTLSGVVMGTPQYMAPEQVAGHAQQIGPAADVYGLGAVLYHLLTGRPPIEGHSMADTLRKLMLDDPVEVRRIAPNVPDDLAAITMKCLEKLPHERYATAAELADDLRRFVSGQPTMARPWSLVQRARRLARRNPLPAAVAALVVVIGLLATGLFVNESRLTRWREQSARKAAAEAEDRARQDYTSDVGRAAGLVAVGDLTAAVNILGNLVPEGDQRDFRDLAWHYLWALATHQPQAETRLPDAVYQIRRSPAGNELAVVGRDGVLRIYDSQSLELLDMEATGQGEVNGVAWSPDATLLATTGDNGTVCLWRREGLLPERQWKVCKGLAYQVLFLDGGTKLAVCGDDPIVRLWDVATGDLENLLTGHHEGVEALALSPDGKLLASAASDNLAILWDWRRGKELRRFKGHTSRLTSVAFSPDGQLLATGSLDNTVRLWDVASGKALVSTPHIDKLYSLAFSSDGQRLFVGDRNGKICDYRLVRDKQASNSIRLEHETLDDRWLGHQGRVWTLLAAKEPGWFYSGGDGGLLQLWAPHAPQQRVQRIVVQGQNDPVRDLAYTRDGSRLFILRQRSGVSILDASAWKTIGTLPSEHDDWQALTLLEERGEVAAGREGGQIVAWNWNTQQQKTIANEDEPYPISRLIYSPAARRLVAVPYGSAPVRLYDPAKGELVRKLEPGNHRTAAFSPDGKRLAIDSEGKVLIYDLAKLHSPQRLSAHSSTIFALTYSPDGALLASTSDDRSVHVWSHGNDPLWSLTHPAAVVAAAFTADGKTLITADEQGGIKLTSTLDGNHPLDIPPPADRLHRLIVAPDSRHLAAIDGEGNLLVVGAARP